LVHAVLQAHCYWLSLRLTAAISDWSMLIAGLKKLVFCRRFCRRTAIGCCCCCVCWRRFLIGPHLVFENVEEVLDQIDAICDDNYRHYEAAG
jgi:hypothetical protein